MKNHRMLSLAIALALCLLALLALTLVANRSVEALDSTLYVAPDGVCGEASPCYATIQEAVDDASDGDTVKIAQGVYTSDGFQVVYLNKAITLTGGYTVTDWLTSYPTTQTTIVDAENVARRRGIYIENTSGLTITLHGLTIQQGYAENSNGGGIYIDGTSAPTITVRGVTGTVAIIRESRILSNTASGGEALGGGVYSGGGALIMSRNNIRGNSAEGISPAGRGAGVYMSEGMLHLYDNTIQDNVADSRGGGVCAYRSTVWLDGNNIVGNAARWGGGVHVVDGAAMLTGNTFQGNAAGDSGGGVYLTEVAATLSANFVVSNTAESAAGLLASSPLVTLTQNTISYNRGDICAGISLYGNGTIVLSGNAIQYNEAGEDYGGGICTWSATTTLRGNSLVGNSAQTEGGAVRVEGAATLHLDENMVFSNTAQLGGAIWAGRGASISLHANSLSYNSASDQGGVIYVFTGTANLDGNNLLSNTAGIYGGGIAIAGGLMNAQNDIIAHNTSPWEGIYVAGGKLTARHWTLVNNGNYALTTYGGSAVLTNTVVVSHAVGGFAGLDIFADHTLFSNSGTPCSGGASCENIFTGNPDFVSPETWDYHIGPDSDAIDGGIRTSVMRDIDHEPRLGIPDLGADEYWAPGERNTIYLPLVMRANHNSFR